jgi:hypothetical protein
MVKTLIGVAAPSEDIRRGLWIKKVKDALIIDLEKRAEYVNMLPLILLDFLHLPEQVNHRPLRDTHPRGILVRNCLMMRRRLFLVTALHGEGLARPSLPVCEYSCMIAFNNFRNQSRDA